MNPFAPPAGVQKYRSIRKARIFLAIFFPTNFVDVDTISGILAYNDSDYTLDGHAGIDFSSQIDSATNESIPSLTEAAARLKLLGSFPAHPALLARTSPEWPLNLSDVSPPPGR